MEIKDDRTTEQKETHTVLIGGTDKYMSGWGKAENGISYAFWACVPSVVSQVEQWVRGRNDIKNVREVGKDYKPKGCKHCHIYVVNANHPALGGAQ